MIGPKRAGRPTGLNRSSRRFVGRQRERVVHPDLFQNSVRLNKLEYPLWWVWPIWPTKFTLVTPGSTCKSIWSVFSDMLNEAVVIIEIDEVVADKRDYDAFTLILLVDGASSLELNFEIGFTVGVNGNGVSPLPIIRQMYAVETVVREPSGNLVEIVTFLLSRVQFGIPDFLVHAISPRCSMSIRCGALSGLHGTQTPVVLAEPKVAHQDAQVGGGRRCADFDVLVRAAHAEMHKTWSNRHKCELTLNIGWAKCR